MLPLMLDDMDFIYGISRSQQIFDRLNQEIREGLVQNGNNPILPGSPLYRKIFDERERNALNQIRDFRIKNPRVERIALIFSARHNFKRHTDLIDPDCIEVPTEFISDLPQN